MKIKQVTRFQVGNAYFDTQEQAERFVQKKSALEAVMDLLPGRPDPNGANYIQRSAEQVGRFIAKAGEWIREYVGDDCADRWAIEPRGFVGRILDDTDRDGYSLYHRLVCIAYQDHREWGQPYYANNPNNGAVELKL